MKSNNAGEGLIDREAGKNLNGSVVTSIKVCQNSCTLWYMSIKRINETTYFGFQFDSPPVVHV